MKRTASIALTMAILTGLLASCGGDTPAVDTTGSTEQTTAEAAETRDSLLQNKGALHTLQEQPRLQSAKVFKLRHCFRFSLCLARQLPYHALVYLRKIGHICKAAAFCRFGNITFTGKYQLPCVLATNIIKMVYNG